MAPQISQSECLQFCGYRVRTLLDRDMAAAGLGLDDIIPDTLDAAPPALVSVEYGGGLKLVTGAVLTPTQVQAQPAVSWPVDADGMYALMLVDPDAPSRADPKFRHWLHWLAGNIPGGRVAEGETLSGYVGSGPPPGTGLHRYIFVALKQPGKIAFEEPRRTSTQIDGRGGWDPRAFISKLGLTPVAANFYKAEWDDYVPKLYESFEK